MLTIKDLSASKELDRAAMADVRGGFFGIDFNPNNDFGAHFLAQSQYLGVSQDYNQGGLNLVISDQELNGVAGQVVGS